MVVSMTCSKKKLIAPRPMLNFTSNVFKKYPFVCKNHSLKKARINDFDQRTSLIKCFMFHVCTCFMTGRVLWMLHFISISLRLLCSTVCWTQFRYFAVFILEKICYTVKIRAYKNNIRGHITELPSMGSCDHILYVLCQFWGPRNKRILLLKFHFKNKGLKRDLI